jgi:hypothetical protein
MLRLRKKRDVLIKQKGCSVYLIMYFERKKAPKNNNSSLFSTKMTILRYGLCIQNIQTIFRKYSDKVYA